MFLYYNVIWILCIILLFISIFMLFKRKQRARQAALNGNYNTTTGQYNPNFIVVDMDGRRTQQQNPYPATYAPPPPTSSQTTYRPPDSSVEPPPPSYQDYTKDHRVPNVQ